MFAINPDLSLRCCCCFSVFQYAFVSKFERTRQWENEVFPIFFLFRIYLYVHASSNDIMPILINEFLTIVHLSSFRDNYPRRRIKQDNCLLSFYSTIVFFPLFIKVIFNRIFCPFIQIRWTEKKKFRCWSPLSNEKQNTHGVVYHLPFTSLLFHSLFFLSFLFSRCSSRIVFPLITYHMNYQISVDSHDRSSDWTHSFLFLFD